MIELPPGFRIVREEDVAELDGWRKRMALAQDQKYRPDVERQMMEYEANDLTDAWGLWIYVLEEAINVYCETQCAFSEDPCAENTCPLFRFVWGE
jgi:hypothetical protein